jgi:UDP-glucose 4-epimerase
MDRSSSEEVVTIRCYDGILKFTLADWNNRNKAYVLHIKMAPNQSTTMTLDPPIRTVLVTGGAGYIGSHTCLELLEHPTISYHIIVVDNLRNSSNESLNRVQNLVGVTPNRLIFRRGDLCDTTFLASVLDEFPQITSCIHFAGLKAVGESVTDPLSYYDTNVIGTINLLKILQTRGIHKFVFSSSATVYGEPEMLPLVENARLQATNPYGRTKLVIEEILRDLHASDSTWQVLLLRYFNPIGAHSSGEIGEDPQGIPGNLMPYIAQVCVGRRDKVSVFGDDYPTRDGTGVRDYIHVVDLAKGHVAALQKLYDSENIGCRAINLGTGRGISVLELIQGMRVATGTAVPYDMVMRRPGDVAVVYADVTLAESFLGWTARRGITDMCSDTWRWQSQNPCGYRSTDTCI